VVFLLMIPFLPLLQYSKRAPSRKPAPGVEGAPLLSNIPEAWPDAEKHDFVEEDEGRLLPHG